MPTSAEWLLGQGLRRLLADLEVLRCQQDELACIFNSSGMQGRDLMTSHRISIEGSLLVLERTLSSVSRKRPQGEEIHQLSSIPPLGEEPGLHKRISSVSQAHMHLIDDIGSVLGLVPLEGFPGIANWLQLTRERHVLMLGELQRFVSSPLH